MYDVTVLVSLVMFALLFIDAVKSIFTLSAASRLKLVLRAMCMGTVTISCLSGQSFDYRHLTALSNVLFSML